MRWSKLKSLVEQRFAPSLDGRVRVYSTRYGDCTCGRAWITVDGEQVANFCTRAVHSKTFDRSEHARRLHGHGEMTRQDAYASCWAFVHELSIDDALNDPDPLVQALAVLDSRVGRRRLEGLEPERLHAMAQDLLRVRLQAEGVRSAPSAS